MAPLIAFNGEETPDKMPLAPVGIPVAFQVVGAEMKMSKTEKPMLEVKMQMSGLGAPLDGTQMFDYFVEPATDQKTQIKLKKFCKAIGVTVGREGLSTELLLGKTGQFVLKPDTYNDEESRRIQAYVLPAGA